MGYELMTEKQETLVNTLREFQEKELRPRIHEIDETGTFPMDLHDKLGKMGFFGVNVPKEYGGMELSVLDNIMVREELGRVEMGFGYAFIHGKSSGGAVFGNGTEEQKKKMADFILNGGIASSAFSEVQAGSDLPAMTSEAKKVGNEYVLNGKKAYVLNGPHAGVFIVLAYTDKEMGSKGMTLFLVESDREGFERTKKYNGMGFRGAETCDIEFHDIVLPEDHVIGEVGKGYSVILSALNKARIVNMSAVLGIGQAAIDYASAYANKRVQFGKPISKLQGIQFLLAEMEMNVQAARQYMIYGGKLLEAGKSKETAIICSGAKAFATEAVLSACNNAIQIGGAVGYSKDDYIEKLWRDARVFSIFEGTNQIQRMLVGKGLTTTKM